MLYFLCLDTSHLENHMEQVKKRHEEARDPLIGQLRAMVEAFKRKEDSREPLYRQLGSLAQTMQASVSQIEHGQKELEQKMNQGLLRYCVLNIVHV